MHVTKPRVGNGLSTFPGWFLGSLYPSGINISLILLGAVLWLLAPVQAINKHVVLEEDGPIANVFCIGPFTGTSLGRQIEYTSPFLSKVAVA